MKRQTGKKKLTLSEHLALRARAAEESKAREGRRQPYSPQALRELDALATCNCPACVQARMRRREADG